ncbi:hypothetical protein BCV70DRAFT_169210 [Testicularia cyperi]|uniref:1-alkyl-2-acetylglycerophosphocholine esterase n=1 Tax=Testicularia cyperi TaxID=1882483 RepID=A0A317XXC5_9BASI|nr:hypothetical protein BCV70DRAFT_169210 [Testicularia cyperi]
MGLPPYSGPFKVGVIDLEIPVRQPRSFCDNVVRPGDLNRPSKRARERAKKLNHDAKQARKETQESGKERPSQSASHSSSASEKWSPWSTGARTCTLHLETVLFTLYYPTVQMSEEQRKLYPRAAWLGRPVHAGVQALFSYLGQYGAFAIPASPAVLTLIHAKMPARVGVPLADPAIIRDHVESHAHGQQKRADSGNFGQRPPSFPVMIFSHGLAGNRLSYSQYCAELASQGIIVAAIEHRDGSGVSSIVRGEEAPDKSEQQGRRDGNAAENKHVRIVPRFSRGSGRQKAMVPYFSFEQIGLQSFSQEPSKREIDLRKDQLAMRHAEIQETLYILQQINDGHGPEIVQRSSRTLGTKLGGKKASVRNQSLPKESIIKSSKPLADWKGKLDLELPTLCGHSFGGATVLEFMRRKDNAFPWAIVLDPWVEPPVSKPAEDESDVKCGFRHPVYVLNSESFSVWREHFEKLKRICLDARQSNDERRGWTMTLCGSKHTDFSDYPFLLPKMFRSTVGPKKTIEVFSKATYMQMGLSRQRAREQQDILTAAIRAAKSQSKQLGEKQHLQRSLLGSLDTLQKSNTRLTEQALAVQSPTQMEGRRIEETQSGVHPEPGASAPPQNKLEEVQEGSAKFTGDNPAGPKQVAPDCAKTDSTVAEIGAVQAKDSITRNKSGRVVGRLVRKDGDDGNRESGGPNLDRSSGRDRQRKRPDQPPRPRRYSRQGSTRVEQDMAQGDAVSGQRARDQLARRHTNRSATTSNGTAISPSQSPASDRPAVYTVATAHASSSVDTDPHNGQGQSIDQETTLGPERQRSYVASVAQISHIDADADVLKVHEQLEEISQSLAYKREYNPPDLSLFKVLDGLGQAFHVRRGEARARLPTRNLVSERLSLPFRATLPSRVENNHCVAATLAAQSMTAAMASCRDGRLLLGA